MKSSLLGGLALLFVGCGGGTSGSFSCDVASATTHACTDTTWSGGNSDPSSTLMQSCTGNGGMVVSSCSHTGAVGGCKNTISQGSVSISTTQWYYSGTASTLMSSCTMNNGAWVNP
jgi:hypothetical protein